MSYKRKMLAEALGTFILVFAGCGAIVVNDMFGQALGHVGISLVWGLVVMAMIYAIGNISGAHLNPAVTLGFWVAKRIKGRSVMPYISAQVLGALVASYVLWWMFPEHATYGATVPRGTVWQAFVMEFFLTFMLMFVVLNVSTGHMEKGIMAGVAVGGVVMLDSLLGGAVSGASMNPARSLGPALVAGNGEALWIYMSAPILGALCASPLLRVLQGEQSLLARKDA